MANELRVSQKTAASPPTFKDVQVTPVASSLLGFSSAVLPVNVTVGTGLSLSAGNVLSTNAGGGTVTSVAASVPGGFSIAGSPVTTTGTLAISSTLNGLIYGDGANTFAAATIGSGLTFMGGTLAATGGGGGTPGGTSGQIQYNNAGAFGGFTTSGDATVNTATGALTIAAGAVTLAKMANIDGTAAELVLGRSTASSGAPETLATTGTRGSAVVLATSPTLVTPVLGIPTSGTLTNCTGYTAGALVESVETASNITSDTSAITIAAATTILRLTANAGPFYLAGLTGGASGRRITLCNVGTNTIILKSSIAAIGTAANRFGTAKQDLPLWPGGALNMVYDSTLSLWQVSCPTDRVIPPRVKGWYGVRPSFPNLGGDVGVFNAASTVSGTSAANTATAGDSTNPTSYVLMTTGTDTTGRAAFGSGSTLFLLGNGWYWAAHIRFLVTTLSDGTDTFSCIAGFGDSAIVAQTDGAYLRYTHSVNSGNWELVLRSNSAENTPINCTAGPTAGTWMDLWIITTPTLVEAYQDGVLIGSTTTLTNLPTGAGRQTGIIASIVKSAGTNARTAQLGLLEVIGYKGTPV